MKTLFNKKVFDLIFGRFLVSLNVYRRDTSIRLNHITPISHYSYKSFFAMPFYDLVRPTDMFTIDQSSRRYTETHTEQGLKETSRLLSDFKYKPLFIIYINELFMRS